MNKELLDKIVSLYTEIDNVGKKIESIKFAETVLLLDSNGINISEDAISFIRERYEANLADLQAELNRYEIVDSVAKTGVSDRPDFHWAKYVATDEDGEVWAYADRPIRDTKSWKKWVSFDAYMEHITPEQAMALCGRVPKWEDEEPTPVINK